MAKATRALIRKSPENHAAKPSPLLIPDEMPDVYAMICEGICLEPEIADGSKLAFDKRVPVQAGDLVVIIRRPEIVREGQHQGIVKRLVTNIPPWVSFPWVDNPKSEVHPLVIAEQFNPPRQFMMKCGDILAIHKCMGSFPDGAEYDYEARKVILPTSTVHQAR